MGSDGKRSKASDFDSENVSRLRLILSRFRKIAFFCDGESTKRWGMDLSVLGSDAGKAVGQLKVSVEQSQNRPPFPHARGKK